jgi:hypothetical protein
MQRLCGQCRSPLADNDVFCGNCGARVVIMPDAPVERVPDGVPLARAVAPTPPMARVAPPAVPQHAVPQHAMPPPAESRARRASPPPVQPAAGQFFSHAAARPAGPMNNATRYLCAAAYLDSAFANKVLSELVGSHRAVVPSRGIDLLPIIRHCLQARKMQLARDVLLVILLLAGLILATFPTILIIFLAFVLGFLPGVEWERKSVGVKLLVGAGVIAVAVIVAVVWFVISFISQADRSYESFGLLAHGASVIVSSLAFVCLLAATLVTYCYVRNRTLSDRLSPGAPGADGSGFDRQPDRVEARIAEVDDAQQGNVTLYDGQNPFIGTGSTPFSRGGERERAWSIAIELDRAKGKGAELWGERGGYVSIDPVELQQCLRDRLLKLKDPALPENERISALAVDDHIVGEGQRRWDSPLIDPVRKIPYSRASDEAIDALIRHPQAGMRYYLLASVSDEGQAVWAGGQQVIDSADQEVTVSAFIYVAVEGRMFYLEFVPAVLSPILQRYHVVDRLPKLTSGQFVLKVVLDAASSAFRDMLHAPAGVIGTLLRMLGERKSFNEEIEAARDYVYADVGAHISVRELGSALLPRTYIQRLDAAKYTQIIERLVTETVLDFLVAKGVDTTAYRARTQMILNSGTIIAGNTNTNMAIGAQASVTAAPAGH